MTSRGGLASPRLNCYYGCGPSTEYSVEFPTLTACNRRVNSSRRPRDAVGEIERVLFSLKLHMNYR